MSLEDFQLSDIEPFDISIVKRDYLKIYHEQGANLKDPDQNEEFVFAGTNNYHQIGNAYLEFDKSVRDTAGVFTDASNIRLINNALAYCVKKGRLSTIGGSDLERNKCVGQVSTIMRLLTSKDSDLSSCFDKSGESPLDDNYVLKRMLFNNHTDADKGRYRGRLELDHKFGFCKTLKKTKSMISYHV